MSVQTIVITAGVRSRVSTIVLHTGTPGRSAYQSYVQTTTDAPVLTEAEWSAPGGGGAAATLSSTDGIATLTVGSTSVSFPATLN